MTNQKLLYLLFFSLLMVNLSLGQADSVKQKYELIPPILEYEPPNEVYTYEKSDVAFLPCHAKGEDKSKENTPWISWWTKNRENLTITGRFKEDCSINGQCGLNIRKLEDDDAGRYQCFISNGVGTATSNSIDIRIITAPQTSVKTVSATEGQPFNLTCKLPENLVKKEETYWIRKSFGSTNVPQELDDERQIFSTTNGSLWFSKILKSDESKDLAEHYFYYIVLPNNKFMEICETILKVKASSEPIPTEVTQLYVNEGNQITEKNNTVKLFCIYGGSPSPKITWEKDGKELTSTKTIKVANSGKMVTIIRFMPEDAGNYTCKVHNNDETVYKEHNFFVKIGKPHFIHEPQKVITFESGKAEFHCAAADADTNFGLKIDWIFNGKPINESDFFKDYVVDYQGGNSTLKINRTQSTHIGNYGCNASNIHGYAYKDVYLLLYPVENVTRTEESNKTLSVKLYEPFSWTCPVRGVPEPRVTFTKDANELKNGDRFTISQDGKTLRINNFSFDDEGKYDCRAVSDVSPDPIIVEINLFVAREPPGFPWGTVVLILLGLLLTLVIVIVWLVYNKNYKVDGIYRVKKREAAVDQNPRIMDEENETMMPAPNAATLNRVRKADNGIVKIVVEETST